MSFLKNRIQQGMVELLQPEMWQKPCLTTTMGIYRPNIFPAMIWEKKIAKIISNVAVLLGLINSNRKIDLAKLVTPVEWIWFTPTAHTVLTHSAQLIEENQGHRLLIVDWRVIISFFDSTDWIIPGKLLCMTTWRTLLTDFGIKATMVSFTLKIDWMHYL